MTAPPCGIALIAAGGPDVVPLRDVPHFEIRKSEIRQYPDISLDKPQAVLPLLREIFAGAAQESFIVVMLDARRRIIGWREVARGAANTVQVPVRETLRYVITLDGLAMIVAHNHPSGDPSPSDPDVAVTVRLAQAGAIVGVVLADHIIIGDAERYYSFAEAGALGRIGVPDPETPPVDADSAPLPANEVDGGVPRRLIEW